MTILKSGEPWPTDWRTTWPDALAKPTPIDLQQLLATYSASFVRSSGRVPNRILIGVDRLNEIRQAVPPRWIVELDPRRPDGKLWGMTVVWCMGDKMELAFAVQPEPETP